MLKLRALTKRLWNDDEGQDLVEYALLVVLIALVVVVTIQGIGHTVNNVFSNANAAVTGYST